MTNSPAQYALREMRRMFTSAKVQIILLAIAVLLGIAGPFGTLEHLPFGPRLAYWVVTVPLTFAVGLLASTFMTERFRDAKSRWVSYSFAAIATAICVSITIICLNWLAFGNAPTAAFRSPTFLLPVMASAALVALVLQYLSDQIANTSEPTQPAPTLMDRLDLNKRGTLISMSVQDHYVEVTTSAGSSLLLMRLSDAMRETGNIDGLQVHRSHWVARAQVTAARRDGDKAVLTLSDGRELPASRSHIKALKEVGILPR